MPQPNKGPRLGGGPAHERLLLANLAAALFTHKSIKTTETKAKRLRPYAERLITFAKRGDLHARRRVLAVIGDKTVVHELFTQIAPLVAEREGGYTRITKLGYRKGDNAPMAQIELVLEPVTTKSTAASKKPARKSTPVVAEPVVDEATEETVPDEVNEPSPEQSLEADAPVSEVETDGAQHDASDAETPASQESAAETKSDNNA